MEAGQDLVQAEFAPGVLNVHPEFGADRAPQTEDVAFSVGRRRHLARSKVTPLVFIDLGGITLAVVTAILAGWGESEHAWPNAALVPLLVATWIVAVGAAGTHDRYFPPLGSEEFKRVSTSAACVVAAFTVVDLVIQERFSLAFVVVTVSLAAALDLVGRTATRALRRRRASKGHGAHRAIAVGSWSEVDDLVEQLRRVPEAGIVVVGACIGEDDVPNRLGDPGVPVLSTLSGIAEIAREHADVVLVAGTQAMSNRELHQLSLQLECSGVQLVFVPAITAVSGPRLAMRRVADLPFVHVTEPRFSGPQLALKGVMDRASAGLALVLLAPMLAVIAVLVRLTSPGPAIYRQRRIGRVGREFTILKFRTMYERNHTDGNDNGKLGELITLNERDGPFFKIRRDPRVTPVGRWLRKYSLDELPQLWNVVRGEMSLVGPRPSLPREVAAFDDTARRRLLIKPGLTGLWQVSGRSDLSYVEQIRLDLHYVDNWSLTTDIRLLGRTVGAVVRARGAY